MRFIREDRKFDNTLGYPGEGPSVSRPPKTRTPKRGGGDKMTAGCEASLTASCRRRTHLHFKRSRNNSTEQKNDDVKRNSSAAIAFKTRAVRRNLQPCSRPGCTEPHFHYVSSHRESGDVRGLQQYTGLSAGDAQQRSEQLQDFSVISTITDRKQRVSEDYPSDSEDNKEERDHKEEQTSNTAVHTEDLKEPGRDQPGVSLSRDHNKTVADKVSKWISDLGTLDLRDAYDKTVAESHKVEQVHISRKTKVVTVYFKGDVERDLLSSILFGVGRALSYVGLTQPYSQSREAPLVNTAGWYEGFIFNYGKAHQANYYDHFLELGYRKMEKLPIYIDLARHLLLCHRSLPRATDRSGKVTDTLYAGMESFVRQNCRAFYENDFSENHRKLMDNTFLWVHNQQIVSSLRRLDTVSRVPTTWRRLGGPIDTVRDTGLSRLPHTEIPFQGEFTDNRRFLRVGKDWNPDGTINLTNIDQKMPSSYHSILGMNFESNYEIGADCASNLNGALQRLTGCRVDEATESILYQDQLTNFPELDLSIFAGADEFLHGSEDLWENMVTAAETHKTKKELYMNTLNMLLDTAQVFDNQTRHNEAKLKLYERVKVKKNMRLFVNLGVHSSLEGGLLLKKVKEALARRIELKESFVQFVPTPNYDHLKDWVDSLVNQLTCAWVHSDDGFYAYKSATGEYSMFNVDIKSCDKSHGPAVFAAFSTLFTSRPEQYIQLLRQLMRPIRMGSKNFNIDAILILLSPLLLSGHNFTTAINSFVLILLLAQCLREGVNTAAGIQEVGLRYGYILTVEKCGSLSDAQFLKHSPVMVQKLYPSMSFFPSLTRLFHSYEPVRNVGVLLRASGMCKGDLPGRGSWESRAAFLILQTLDSLYPNISNPFLTLLRSRVAGHHITTRDAELIRKYVIKEYLYKSYMTPGLWFITDEDLFRRYRLTPAELSTFFGLCRDLRVGKSLNSRVAGRVMFVDYGLVEATEHPDYAWEAPGVHFTIRDG